MYKFRLSLLIMTLVAIAGFGAAGTAGAAKGDRTAYVAGAQQVTLAKSRFSSRELKARRSQVDTLIPRVQ